MSSDGFYNLIVLVSKSTGSRSKAVPKLSFRKTPGGTMFMLGIEDLMISQLYVMSSEFEDVSDWMDGLAD